VDELLKRIASQVSDVFKSMGPAKIAALAVGIFSILAVGAGVFFWAGRGNYVPLMTNLTAEDSTSIIRILREKHIPFRVDPTGKIISVPPDSLYEFRLELATMGYPQTGVVGYEIFDKQSLGTTSFVQRMNQKRAQEGELVRTINTIKGVKRSRVHLVIPQKSTFVEDQKKSTASVVVDLEPGTVLSEKLGFGIGT
jgi:flagellar M-ring protein FliF